MQKNYKLKIAYDGTRYYGWEHQPDQETIQGKIETVLARMLDIPFDKASIPGAEPDSYSLDYLRDKIELIGAGRTDAGVHAAEMTASVILDIDMTEEEIRDYLNRYLPDDIAVSEVRLASDRFHARYNAAGKTYRYTIFNGDVKPVFDRKYYTYIEDRLDVGAMRAAAEYMMGEHDFKSFCGNPKMKKSTVRIVDKIEIRQSRGYIYITYHGTGFLQNMVRIMTGTLIEVGLHRMKPEQVEDIIGACDRKQAGPTAPAKGLMLMSVDY